MRARWKQRFLKLLAWGRREPTIPLLLLLIAGGLWGFVELADEVQDQETHHFDKILLLAMRQPGNVASPLGPRWVGEAARDFTAMGGAAVLTLVTLAVTGFLFFQGNRRIAAVTLGAVIGGQLLTYLLKEALDRTRPDLVPHAVVVTSASFPSGHAMMAAVVYLTLGVLLARTLPRRRLRVYVIAFSVLIALLVGVSRVYLGVHWPTDVLAGWTLGAAWALVCWLIAIHVDPRKHMARSHVSHVSSANKFSSTPEPQREQENDPQPPTRRPAAPAETLPKRGRPP